MQHVFTELLLSMLQGIYHELDFFLILKIPGKGGFFFKNSIIR